MKTNWETCGERRFTLIELLTVVAILLILVAMLLPSLETARHKGVQVKCMANLKQIGSASMLYAMGGDRYLPASHTNDNMIIWPTLLRIYGGGEGVFSCPGTGRQEPEWVRSYGSGLTAEYGYEANEVRIQSTDQFSYGWNNWGSITDWASPHFGLGTLPGHAVWGETRMSKIQQPADMIAVSDSFVNGSWDAFIDPNDNGQQPDFRHFNTTSVIFADGHVEAEPYEAMMPATSDVLPRWNIDHEVH